MYNKQKFIAKVMSTILIISTIIVSPIIPNSVEAASITKKQAINKYYNFQDSYNKHELPIIKSFEKQYDGSLAHQIVARAIWYMEHGYTVYNTANYSLTGQLDCSYYTRVVYGDFGFKITSVSRSYNQVGTKVSGVSSTKVGTSASGKPLYGIKGIENLRPGDILTYWAGTESNKYISHVSIYMGVINGKPAVINTVSNRPTALGIVNNFNYWFGEKFLEARRVLPKDAWNPSAAYKYKDSGPIIPSSYYLPPQKPIVMPKNSTSSSSATEQVKVTGNIVNVRSGPGTNYSITGVVKNGDIVSVIGKSGSWLNIRMANGTTGYIANSLVTSYTTGATQNILISKVTGNIINVRATATSSATILGVIHNGDEVVVKRQLDGWYEIDWNGQSGYVASFLLSTPIGSSTVATNSLATVTGGVVNIRSGAGTNYNILAVVSKGDTVEIISHNNDWVKVKTNDITGYVASWLVSIR